jgi:hypothetical protein
MRERSEIARVRVFSRLAAVALVGFVVTFALLLPVRAALPVASNVAAVSIVSIADLPSAEPARLPPRRVKSARAAPAAANEASAPDDAADGHAHMMWLHGAAGRVTFDDTAHYLRCLDAALAYKAAPRCPPPPPSPSQYVAAGAPLSERHDSRVTR